MGIVVIGATFVDIKGFPEDAYIPNGRNVGRVEYIHGGVGFSLQILLLAGAFTHKQNIRISVSNAKDNIGSSLT